MAGFRGIQTSLFWTLMFLSTAVTGLDGPSFTVRVGDKVTLPCGNLRTGQLSCDTTTWLSTMSSYSEVVELVTLGKISNNEIAKAKSKRLRVTEDCSLVITDVTDRDFGRYACRQFAAGQPNGEDAHVFLSVINTESHDALLIYCTVLIYGECCHSVQWLYEGNRDDIEMSPGTCTAVVTLKTHVTHPDQKFQELLYCNVTDQKSGRSLLMRVSPQSSAEEEVDSTSKEDTTGDTTQEPSDWWRYAAAAAGVAALLITITMVMMFIRRKKTKGMKTQRDEGTGQSLRPAESQCDAESGQERVDPGDEVSYATVSYTKKISSRTQAADADGGVGGGDEGDTVTYSTVKVSSPADKTSVDPSSLYATVHRAEKGETPG